MIERVIPKLADLARQPSDISELAERSFKIETLLRGDQTLELISLEATHIDNEQITPLDWQEQVSEAVERAGIVFVEYFLPELEENISRFHELGKYSSDIAAVYGTIADIAHSQNTPIAVADIANKPLYELYQMGLCPAVGAVAVASARYGGAFGKAGFVACQTFLCSIAYQSARQKGKHGIQPGLLERFTPDATDARRALTARGIEQTAQTLPSNASLLYIAAPAHVSRVKAMLTKDKTIPDSAKAVAYKGLVGLDRSTRIYSPTENGWELSANHPIR